MPRKRDSAGQFTRLRDKVQGGFVGTGLGAACDAVAQKATQQRYIPANKTANRPNRINLKAVAEVLMEQGLDPTEEIIRILRPVDPETGLPLRCLLDEDVQARILNELLQYTQPKLKSIEVRAKVAATSFDVNDLQARVIAEEFLLASNRQDATP